MAFIAMSNPDRPNSRLMNAVQAEALRLDDRTAAPFLDSPAVVLGWTARGGGDSNPRQ